MKKELIKKLADALKKKGRLELAIIYGSTAHGRDTPKSDLDIGIALKRPMNLTDKLNYKTFAEKIVGREIDLVDLHTIRGVILEEALCRGDVVVKKNPELYAFLMKRMWFDRADFMPSRDMILKKRRERFLK